MDPYIQTTLSLLAVINPFVCVAMLLELDEGLDKKAKIASIFKAMLPVLLILLISAVIGHYILAAFGISMDAFKIIGGIILSFIGFKMLVPTSSEKKNNNDLSELILFAASPGTIAMVITLAVVHNPGELPIKVIIGIILAVAVTITIMLVMMLFGSAVKSNKQGIMSRFMGLIIVAMGLQFMLDGIKDFF